MNRSRFVCVSGVFLHQAVRATHDLIAGFLICLCLSDGGKKWLHFFKSARLCVCVCVCVRVFLFIVKNTSIGPHSGMKNEAGAEELPNKIVQHLFFPYLCLNCE